MDETWSPQVVLWQHVPLVSIEICCSEHGRETISGGQALCLCHHGRLHLSRRPHRCICVEIVRAHVLHMAGAKHGADVPDLPALDCEPRASFIVAANNANW
jgi:hypothetical protein